MELSNIRGLRSSSWWYPVVLCTLFIAFVLFIGLVQPPFWFRVFLSFLFLIYVLVSFFRERERTTRELERAHEMQDMAERLGRVGSWEFDIKAQEARYSSNLYDLYGIAPGVQPFADFIEMVHPSDRSAVLEESEAVMAGARPSIMEYRIVRPDGETRLMRAHAYPTENGDQLFGYVADITDTKPDEEQEALLERMQAASVLAAGLAHDFNNLLQVVLTNLNLIRQYGPSEEQARLLDETETVTREAGDWIGQLREFAAPQVDAPSEPIVIDDLIDEVLPTLRRAVPSDIHFTTRLNASSLCVTGSRPRLRQLVMNLVFNARDAADRGGEITLETRPLSNGYPAGDWRVHLCVSDTGKGIDTTAQSHIFEPFSSTKDRGSHKGTGLGLAI